MREKNRQLSTDIERNSNWGAVYSKRREREDQLNILLVSFHDMMKAGEERIDEENQ